MLPRGTSPHYGPMRDFLQILYQQNVLEHQCHTAPSGFGASPQSVSASARRFTKKTGHPPSSGEAESFSSRSTTPNKCPPWSPPLQKPE